LSALDDLPPPAAMASPLDDLPPPTRYDPSEGGSTLQVGPFDTGIQIGQTTTRALTGAGKAAYDIARGTGQWLGLESREDVAESRKRDAPLMATTAGKVGDIAGNVAFTAPAMLIPGANAPAGAAAVGAVMGALQPSMSSKETAENIGLGGVTGAAGSWLGGKIADAASAWNAARKAAADTLSSLGAERDSVLAAGRSAGYVVPPTAVNPSAVNTALESVSGKAATRQAAAESNQKVTNTLVRRDLGIPKDAPITQQTLANVRAQAGQVYEAVKGAGRVVSDPQYANDLQSALTGSPQLQSAYAGIGG